MRFTNTPGVRGSRETYNPSRSRTINTGAGDGVKTVYAQFNDSVNNILNTGYDIIYDTLPPQISSGYIGSGMTAQNNGNIYYAGQIHIRANVYDAGVGMSGSTCRYSIGAGRNSAGYGI